MQKIGLLQLWMVVWHIFFSALYLGCHLLINLWNEKFRKKVKIPSPQKSIFGFRILTAWQSTFAAYLMLIPLLLLPPSFGVKPLELKAGLLFFIVINLSIIILTINSLIQKNKSYFYNWILFNFPLWCLLPLEFKLLFSSFKSLVFN